ncbi:MAG TPA: cytidine deaminase [Fodinibius sp.]|nr:cytidine deaminase [Fodinibius sp.]
MDIKQLYRQSYVPYSKQQEVAIVRSAEGRYFPGKRIENAAYPLSISAAQNALFCCLSEGDNPQKLFVSRLPTPLLSYWKEEFNISITELSEEQNFRPDFADIVLHDLSSPLDLLVPLLDRACVEESNFPVAALAKTNKGWVSGVNIECSAWSMGLCAERVAISKALTYTEAEITELHIHARYGEFSSPCGACRQVISEHLPDRKLYLHHANGSQSVHFSNDLLPFSFQSSSLPNQ